ncbi:MAG: phosphatase [Bacteroidota bacterium]
MKLAVIDIGSNAIRFQVTNILHYEGVDHFKRLEYVRFPLRLGQDVFSSGRLMPLRIDKFHKLMKAFSLLIELYEVDHYMACATSAMRESENGREVAAQIKKQTGLEIQIIDGAQEAKLINKAISEHLDARLSYMHIDVGGGSTELNLIRIGNLIGSKSFQIGSVRRMDHLDSPEIWSEMEHWITSTTDVSELRTAIGTGGNINKLFELGGKVKGQQMQLTELKEVQKMLVETSLQDKIYKLQLNPDRADVIVPASEIYISVMERGGIDGIIVPDVGLKDGMIKMLYETHSDVLH